MTKQIMKLTTPHNGTWKIIQDDSDRYNPYRVYRIHDGHKKLISKYGDLASCLHCITQQITGHIWKSTREKVERLF
jgi:hypothetical protein